MSVCLCVRACAPVCVCRRWKGKNVLLNPNLKASYLDRRVGILRKEQVSFRCLASGARARVTAAGGGGVGDHLAFLKGKCFPRRRPCSRWPPAAGALGALALGISRWGSPAGAA